MDRIFKSLVIFVAVLAFISVGFAAEIHEAAKSGDIVKLKSLIDQDKSLLYLKDEVGKTPLHWATGRGQLETMKVLLDEYHVNVDVRNNNEGTPLHVAASQAQPEGAKILIAHKATVNARTKNGSTPLHFACFKGRKPGHIEAARILIENGADVNAKTDQGMTPLSMAMMRNNAEIIKLLKAHGAKSENVLPTRRFGEMIGRGRIIQDNYDLLGGE